MGQGPGAPTWRSSCPVPAERGGVEGRDMLRVGNAVQYPLSIASQGSSLSLVVKGVLGEHHLLGTADCPRG